MPLPVKRMAAATKAAPKPAGRRVGGNVGSRPPLESLALPSRASVPVEDLCGYTYLFFGERKIGKTTLSAQFPDPFFMMFEPGGRALSIKQADIQTWPEFLQYIALLEANPGYCKTIVIDTGYMAYERCFEWCLTALGLEDPRDEGWGNGWKAIDREFRQAHQRLFNIGIGVIITAHSELREIKAFDGTLTDKVVTQLGKQATRYYAGTVDVIAYYTYDRTGARVLQIRGNQDVEAGTRIKGHFQYDNGQPVIQIPMGTTEEQGYANLRAAFDNTLKAPAAATTVASTAPIQRKGGAPALKR